MATRPPTFTSKRQVPARPPTFASKRQTPALPPQTSPTAVAAVARPHPLASPGVGGGTPVAPAALDPRGLVPVNRTQPVATDNMEAQRIMERRLGSMPPSSFAGAGAGFVPVGATPSLGGRSFADRRTDVANAEMGMNNGTASTPPVSAEGLARAQMAASMGGPARQAPTTAPAAAQATAPWRRGLLGRFG